MAPIRQDLCPPARYSVKCPFTRTPSRVVIHNTGNDAPAANEIAYMLRNDYEVSFHYAVDDQEIVQGLPEERNAWASGDGRGKGNLEGMSRMVKGQNVDDVIRRLRGTPCGSNPTSCPDQLSWALEEAKKAAAGQTV